MLGNFALLLALGVAAWVLFRAAKGGGDEQRGIFRLKLLGLLAVSAVLFAAKLFPVALMILVAAGGVTAIEIWRGRAIKALDDLTPGAGAVTPVRASLGVEEAAAILGVDQKATEEEIKAAHKKLIAQLHPDKGGSDYLAAKINDARKKMLESLAGARQQPD